MRRLIVNADDFGFTSGVNRAIVEAHTRGIVTSCTLMANGPAFTEAASATRSTPTLDVGCHVVLIDGEPALPAEQIPSLAQAKNGQFRQDLKRFAVCAVTGRLRPEEIEAEATAQIRKLQSVGIAVSHIDTHKHAHLFPRVLDPLLRGAAACGVRAVRNPFGPRMPLRSHQLLARPNLWTRFLETRVLGRFASKFRGTVDRQGFVTTDGTLGIEVTGALDERLFRAIAESMPEGTWEFVCHPGYNDAELQSARTRLRESRQLELEVLTLPAARQLLAEHGISLISYRDLVPG
ncbi:MAG TPA: ChbG/HpnK family deacetylase [Candidatus Sulfotelmatobacter sp.]|nr:ChbG/HpnK family deacetylase [Candidatus Sulfotelmatobacter sp.]